MLDAIRTFIDVATERSFTAVAKRRDVAVSSITRKIGTLETELGTKLLEVYLPVHAPNGTPLLFEAYFTADSVSASGSRLWRSFAPIALGALVMLELVQVPLAWSLARRLRERLEEREQLLQHVLDASEVERRQISESSLSGVMV